jgi:serine/threonine protein phosphatase PrpC
MKKYTKLRECVVDGDENDNYTVWLVVEQQSFCVCDGISQNEAEWMQEMLVQAINKIIKAEKDKEIAELKEKYGYLLAHHNEEATTAYDEISDCRSEIAELKKKLEAAKITCESAVRDLLEMIEENYEIHNTTAKIY